MAYKRVASTELQIINVTAIKNSSQRVTVPSKMFQNAARRAFAAVPRSSVAQLSVGRTFTSSSAAFVKRGDAVPDVELFEDSPGNKVSIAKVLKGKGLIIGVPAAFSKTTVLAGWIHAPETSNYFQGPSCSETHIPGYINYEGLKDAG